MILNRHSKSELYADADINNLNPDYGLELTEEELMQHCDSDKNLKYILNLNLSKTNTPLIFEIIDCIP